MVQYGIVTKPAGAAPIEDFRLIVQSRKENSMMLRVIFCSTLFAALLGATGLAPAHAASSDPRNAASAVPPVPRPSTRPCVVTLFSGLDFGERGENTRMDAAPHPFAYAPPARCPGPWGKVVLEADYSVDAGRQYDRTASIWLNGVALYFGTTQEPSPDFGPSWHVERDLTDYTALLGSAGTGAALINNWLDDKRASVIHGTARLLFYPAVAGQKAAVLPDRIYAISDGRNATTDVQDGNDAAQRLLVFPRNVTHAYLDIFPQSQFHDEFWYMCLPDAAIDKTAAFAMKRGYHGAPKRPRACGGGAFREVEVSIDGRPAGRAPVYPWIYTGGLLPYLWRPTPGIETLNFKPYRMDLAPFVGLLDDGKQHVISIHVSHANHYFSLAAALLIYQDPTRNMLSGGITQNTLETAKPVAVHDTLHAAKGTTSGDVITTAAHNYIIEGFLDGPDGRTVTRISQKSDFTNSKTFNGMSPSHLEEDVKQTTATENTTEIHKPDATVSITRQALDYTLVIHSRSETQTPQLSFRRMTVEQGLKTDLTHQENGEQAQDAQTVFSNTASAEGTIDAAHGSLAAGSRQDSRQDYAFHDSQGQCVRHSIGSRNGAVISDTTDTACQQDMH